MTQIEEHYNTLDAIQSGYQPGTTDHRAFVSLNGLLFQTIKGSDSASTAAWQKVNNHIASHSADPALHADMMKTKRLFAKIVELLIVEIIAEGGAEAQGAEPNMEAANG